MNGYIQRAPYPAQALPQKLQDFASAVIHATQSTYDMVVPVMLASMSAAVQGVADVQTPYGDVMPASLFTCVIAKSGDRKSSVLKKMMYGFEDFERGQLERDFTPGWKNSEIFKSHPFLIEDATDKGVIDIFKDGANSLFYSLDEGAILFKNLNIPGLCKRFDGSAINEVSRTQGLTILHDKRVALCMLTQDVTFDRLKKKKGDLLVDSGLMPRMLISQATAQFNIHSSVQNAGLMQSIKTGFFNQRVRALMREYADSLGCKGLKRQIIRFEPQAASLWEQYIQGVEFILMHHVEWNDVRAFMRRSGELVIRVAAVLQYFLEPSGEVQPWAVASAIEIVRWHMLEAKRIFGEESFDLKLQKDVNNLYEYLQRRQARTRELYVLKSEMLRYAPMSLRSADVLDMAINQLYASGRVNLMKVGRKEYLCLNSSISYEAIKLPYLLDKANW